MNLVEATAREIARVAELLPRATEILPSAGIIAAPLMRELLDGAAKALGSGDAIETLRAYHQLQAFRSAAERLMTKMGEPA